MITNFIIASSVILALAFVIAWIVSPELRRRIESPKHAFQDQLERYNRHCHDEVTEPEVESNEPR